MIGTVGNSEFCFALILNVPLGFVSGNIEGHGETKLTVSLGVGLEMLNVHSVCIAAVSFPMPNYAQL